MDARQALGNPCGVWRQPRQVVAKGGGRAEEPNAPQVDGSDLQADGTIPREGEERWVVWLAR